MINSHCVNIRSKFINLHSVVAASWQTEHIDFGENWLSFWITAKHHHETLVTWPNVLQLLSTCGLIGKCWAVVCCDFVSCWPQFLNHSYLSSLGIVWIFMMCCLPAIKQQYKLLLMSYLVNWEIWRRMDCYLMVRQSEKNFLIILFACILCQH